MGTPAFAVPSLRTLIEGKDRVVGVVTQPDQPAGRGMVLHVPPIKVLATSHSIPVFQPARLRDPAVLFQLQSWQPDLIVVVAYGKMLPQTVLALPPYGCINVHASLLPKYRGAAPVQWAIACGERETGVTIMYISERMDAGDLLLQKTLPIADDDTGGTLHDKLAALGANALGEALPLLKAGQLVAHPQNEADATYAPLIHKEEGRIDWHQDVATLERRIRAFNPWPSAYTTVHGKLLKIFAAHRESTLPRPTPPPGTVAEVTPVSLVVAAGDGYLALSEVQLEGKKRLPIAEFLKGYPLTPGLIVGTSAMERVDEPL
ncbi:MAG: methionyl-tRNA formyltransferase [Deltaproteobacteria bacterium]|nr:methionyl-tRNA formyltransferase [Deltaproteobacteria bacterium]